VPIDNEIYDRLADTWWDPTGILHVIRTGLNPVRFGYAQEVLDATHQQQWRGLRALDIGCGGGLLAEEFARIGYQVTGIDPSSRSIQVAGDHARLAGLEIDYIVARGEAIPFDDAAFDVVYCCDVLEHVDDLSAVIAETARVLKPGGIYIYDTLNRTPVSRFVAITLLERWLKLAPMHLHDARRFIRPSELRQLMQEHGIHHQETVGIVPGVGPVVAAQLLWRLKRGLITYPEVGRRLRLKTGRSQLVSFIGYGVKQHT
jgi:2-polyprenyl-6-hydroxyphenyl methylase / 3-demethylubiquinone-9 3-methyltransferase